MLATATLRKIIRVGIFLLVIGTPLFYLKQSVYPYTLSKAVFFEGIIELIFGAWLALIILEPRYLPARPSQALQAGRPRSSPLLVGLAVFLAVLTLTGALGVDPWRSFWSIQERALGVVTILHAAAFALILVSLGRELPWQKIFYVSLGTTLLTDVLALLQLRIPDLLLVEGIGTRPGGTFGNPAFLAGYLTLHIFIGLYFLLLAWSEAERKRPKQSLAVGFLILTLLVNLITLDITQTRGDLLGVAVGLLVLTTLFYFKPPTLRFKRLSTRKFYGAVLLVLVLSAGLFGLTKDNAFWQKIPGVDRFTGISLNDPGLQPRFIALQAAWLGFLERPLLGWGWDNFNIVFNKHYDPRALELDYQETRFDKPHNVFMENLVAGGFPLALAYYGLIVLVGWTAWRAKDRLFAQILTAALAAYVIRSLFVFETLGPLLIFYLLLGYTAAEAVPAPATSLTTGPRNSPQAKKLCASLALGGGLILALLLNGLTLVAVSYQYDGFNNFSAGRVTLAIQSFETAINIWSPLQWNLKRDFAAVTAEAYFYNSGVVSQADAWLAVNTMQAVIAEHPADAYNHYAFVDMLNQVSDLDSPKLLPLAEREAAIALQLSPNRQEIYFSLAKTKSLEGDYPSALVLLEKALALDPKVPDAHFYYGLVAYAAGKPDIGYAELKTAIALGRPWKNNDEPRVVANYFADSGHLADAIELYQAALKQKPSDIEARVKLGIAYYYAGEHDLARQYLTEVARQFDLTTSKSYPDLIPILKELDIQL